MLPQKANLFVNGSRVIPLKAFPEEDENENEYHRLEFGNLCVIPQMLNSAEGQRGQ